MLTAPELEYTFHGFSEADLDRDLVLDASTSGGFVGFLKEFVSSPHITLREVVDRLNATYSSTIGIEYLHMSSRAKCNWIREHVEVPSFMSLGKEEKIKTFERLARTTQFEGFLNSKFNTTKRFGLDGGETLIPGINALVDKAHLMGVTSIVLGMPHRGRLNVLANVMGKSLTTIFREFQGTHFDLEKYMNDSWSSAGDVKYHLGTSHDKVYEDGSSIHLSLVANPSHLEAVNPVVAGKARAKQFFVSDKARRHRTKDLPEYDTCLPVLFHGDASVAGQGIIYELMNMSKVEDFDVGGTIHIICNNQVGFTTNPISGRSTLYCTDIAKAFDVPVFHCNGDDPVSVVTAFELAVEWRQHFNEDVMIDLVCYRKYGHNELDQPLFTQPVLYQKIAEHKSSLAIYEETLKREEVLDQKGCDAIISKVNQDLEEHFNASKDPSSLNEEENWLGTRWKGFKSKNQMARIQETGFDLGRLEELGLKLTNIPEDFQLHPLLKRIYKARRSTLEKGEGIDWGTAESLAFGSLLLEGNCVRLTGQDVERGTFSHRHAVLHDQRDESEYIPLNNIAKHLQPSAPLEELVKPDIQVIVYSPFC